MDVVAALMCFGILSNQLTYIIGFITYLLKFYLLKFIYSPVWHHDALKYGSWLIQTTCARTYKQSEPARLYLL